MLHEFMIQSKIIHHSMEADSWEMYSALIPSLRPESLRSNPFFGEGWALIGDAAGFADPITCEGIHYALRSGELLAEAIIECRPDSYAACCTDAFVADFVEGSGLFERFYSGDFLGSDFITRMVQTAARSASLRSIMNHFIAGHQDYRSLRRNLFRKAPRVVFEAAASILVDSRSPSDCIPQP